MYNLRYSTLIYLVAAMSIFAGYIVLLGWVLSYQRFVTLFWGNAPMKFCTSVCLLFTGGALLLLFRRNWYYVLLRRFFAAMVMVLAAISFFGNIYNYDFVFNKAFAAATMSGKHFSGRMSLFTSLCFFIIGLGPLVIHSQKAWVKITVQWLLHFASLMSMIAVMGHVYEVSDFNHLPFLSTMGINAAVALFVLSVAESMANPEYGITGLLSGNKTGNIMARRLFPMIVILLLGVTYIRLQIYRQLEMDMGFITILFTVCLLLINLFLIWSTALQLNRTDVERKAAEESILQLNKSLEQKVELRTEKLRRALLELEKSQQELHDSLSKEKELNEIKSRFVSMASHEFKTPLSTILSSASLIAKYEDKEGHVQRDKHVQRIKNSVAHLNSLLEEFLSLGRLESGRVLIDRESLQLKDFLRDISEEVNLMMKPGQRFQMQELGLPIFTTDRRLLKNILLNLLSNAIKFSLENSTIEMQVSNSKRGLFISIKDAGIGIAEEDKPYLFSTFFRGGNTTNIEGTGLGLHIVKRYVELLNGTIEVKSELDKGTTFFIDFPVQREAININA